MSWESRVAPAPAPPAPPQFRPLSIGELFDRAFTIYIRNVLTFAALLFVVVVPIAVIQYFMTHDLLDAYMSVIQSAMKHSTTPPDISKLNEDALAAEPWTGVYYLLLLFALPLANAAVVSGVSRAYLGLPVRFRACYADAFRRWGYVLILTLLWLIVLLFVFGGGGILLIFVIALLAAAGTFLKTFGIIISAVIGITLTLAFIGLVIMGYMAFASSFIACVLEKADPIKSFTLGVSRIFGGGLFWRSLGVAAAIFFVGFGFALVIAFLAGLAFWFTKSAFTYIAISQLANVFLIAFAFVVVALYYYDIRIRREGFDIQLLAEQLETATRATATATPPSPSA